MTKSIFRNILVVMGLFLAVPASAAVFNFSPTSVNTEAGKDFALQISLNPQATANYTAKIELNYPADTLEVKSFTFGDDWMKLKQPGYDAIDNTNGALIKTAGYPGGISSPVSFGTVYFHAKKTGNAVISATANSLVLDSLSKNVLSSIPNGVSVAVKETVQTPATPSKPGTTSEPAPTTPSEEKPAEENVNQGAVNNAQASLLSSAANILTLGTNNPLIGVMVVVIILAIFFAAYLFGRRSCSRKS